MIIPIIVYHGKPKGKTTRLVDLIDLPHPDMACYVPTFDTVFGEQLEFAVLSEFWPQTGKVHPVKSSEAGTRSVFNRARTKTKKDFSPADLAG